MLDETERSIIVEALYNDLHYNFPVHVLQEDNKNKYRLKKIDILEAIKLQSGGFRLVTTDDNLYLITQSLRWNANFIVTEKERNNVTMDKYTNLSYVLEGRNEKLYLFGDFNPKEYNPNTKLKTFPKFDFTKKRLFLIRFEKDKMEFIREFYRKDKETDEQYTNRAQETAIKDNKDCVKNAKYNKVFENMEYKIVDFNEVVNFKLKKGFSYHP